jgi:hypothetical protein
MCSKEFVRLLKFDIVILTPFDSYLLILLISKCEPLVQLDLYCHTATYINMYHRMTLCIL